MFRLLALAALMPTLAFGQVVPLVTGPDFAPYVNPARPESGLASDIVQAAFAASGRQVSIELRPWARALLEAKEGKFLASFPYTKTPEREAAYFYSSPVLFVRHRIFVKAGDTRFNSKDIDSLKGATYCVPIGRAVNPRLVDMVSRGLIMRQTPSGTSNCLRMLELGRVDFLVSDEKEGRAQIREAGMPGGIIVMADGPPLTEIPLHVIAGKDVAGGEDIIQVFNAGLAKIQRSGAYARIQKSYQN